jgi:predicted RNA-binding protein with PIN domain
MQIFPEQVAAELRVDAAHSLVKELVNNLGVNDPKVILVFDSNKGAADEAKHPWKVRVFYNSPDSLQHADLDVETVLQNTKIKARDNEIIRTIYPGRTIGWCGKINGVQVWIT